MKLNKNPAGELLHKTFTENFWKSLCEILSRKVIIFRNFSSSHSHRDLLHQPLAEKKSRHFACHSEQLDVEILYIKTRKYCQIFGDLEILAFFQVCFQVLQRGMQSASPLSSVRIWVPDKQYVQTPKSSQPASLRIFNCIEQVARLFSSLQFYFQCFCLILYHF
jgi:hypothetical protein